MPLVYSSDDTSPLPAIRVWHNEIYAWSYKVMCRQGGYRGVVLLHRNKTLVVSHSQRPAKCRSLRITSLQPT